MMTILLYGANGFTGRLIADEMIVEGLEPILAGRNYREISNIADELGLQYRIFELNNPIAIATALEGIDLVVHAAGPYKFTAKPMIDACIEVGVHYMDISGEIESFEYCVSQHDLAEKKGIVLLPGMGFDIIPTENLAAMLIEKFPNATQVDVAILSGTQPSKGTTKSSLGIITKGSMLRKDKKLLRTEFGEIDKDFEFLNGKTRTCVNSPLPDIIALYEGYKIPNIRMFMSMNPKTVKKLRRYRWLIALLKYRIFGGIARFIVDKTASNPSEEYREQNSTFITAELTVDGQIHRAYLQTPDAYNLTAELVTQAAITVMNTDELPRGYQSPSKVLGTDFIVSFDDVILKLEE